MRWKAHLSPRPCRRRDLHERIAPYADHITTTLITVSPALGHYVAKLEHLLGRHDDADASFRQALAIHEKLESHVLVAMTQAAWAAMLTDPLDTDHDHARTLASDALDIATHRGWGGIEREARAVLDELG